MKQCPCVSNCAGHRGKQMKPVLLTLLQVYLEKHISCTRAVGSHCGAIDDTRTGSLGTKGGIWVLRWSDRALVGLESSRCFEG